jgi:4-hydroxy-tetrahydrodipicolinate synthase
MSVLANLTGVIPPTTTPFRADGSIAFGAMRKQIDWLLNAGASGIAVGGSTGEGHTLTKAEFDRIISAANDALAGRAPLIAGIIVNSTREAIIRGESAATRGATALQVTPPHYLFRPDDTAMIEHFRAITEATEMPVIIYNVVPWTYLSPELLCRIFDELPGVVGVKQSAGDLKLFADLMEQAPADRMIFSAVDALMYPSYMLGAHGSIAAILTAAPHASVALWNAVQAGDQAGAKALHGKLLALWNAMAHDNLPACVKFAQRHQGVNAGQPRAPMPLPSGVQRRAIIAALEPLTSE